MTTLDASTVVTAFGAVFLPLLIAFFRGRSAPRSFAAVWAFFCVFLWTVLAWFLTDKLDWGQHAGTLAGQVRTLLVNLLATAVTAYTTYKSLWQPVGATGSLEATGPQLGGVPAP